jgi:hypothetical protein
MFDGFGFINEHDGNIVSDFVEQFAMVADKPVLGFIEVYFPLALGADQDIQ